MSEPAPAAQLCTGTDLGTAVDGYQRVLAFGHLKPGQPARTGAALRADLAAVGTVVAEGPYGPTVMALVVEVRPAAERTPAGCYRLRWPVD